MISTQKKFIFLHIPKTGGNSVQDALRTYADDELVVLSPHQDGIERFEVRNKKFKSLKKHSSLNEYYRALGEQLNDYFVFTTIRNPYDKLVSNYFSPHRGNVEWNSNSFEEFVKSNRSLESYLYVKKGLFAKRELCLDMITRFLKFENLSEEFEDLTSTLQITDAILNHRNKSLGRRRYQDCYDDELRDYVSVKHKLEIELGNYAF